ncbi:MAG TPA: hypothetical protein VGM64_19190 [Lacunisphaera sp.]|jgi:hypothetical protein
MKPLFFGIILFAVPFVRGVEITWNVDTATAVDFTITGGLGVPRQGSSVTDFGLTPDITSDSGLWTYQAGNTFSVNLNDPVQQIWSLGGGALYFNPAFTEQEADGSWSKSIVLMGYSDPEFTPGTGDITTYDTTTNEFGLNEAAGIVPWKVRSALTLHRPVGDDVSTWTWVFTFGELVQT